MAVSFKVLPSTEVDSEVADGWDYFEGNFYSFGYIYYRIRIGLKTGNGDNFVLRILITPSKHSKNEA